MLQKGDIDRFYEDLKLLELRMAGASIVKATKESKGNVSAYINRKREPSENFLRKFYDSFGKEIAKKRQILEQKENPPVSETGKTYQIDLGQPLELAGLKITLGDYINEITRTKAFLERMLDGGLKELKASLDEQAQLLSAVQSDLLAKSEVALNSLAKIQNPKKPPKLNAEADKISQQRQGMRPHMDSGIGNKEI